ncbi:MAG: hypothetical protein ABIF77_21030, partial [bacterium]
MHPGCKDAAGGLDPEATCIPRVDARGYLHKYVYDPLGRIERVSNAEANTSVLTTEQSEDFQRVTFTTPEGRVTRYETVDTTGGTRTMKVIFPDNTYNQSVIRRSYPEYISKVVPRVHLRRSYPEGRTQSTSRSAAFPG